MSAFEDPVGVPAGWRFEPASEANDSPSWVLDHESGLRLEVYPPTNAQNPHSWQVRDTGTDRVVAWNVCWAGRDPCFTAALPGRVG